MKIYDWKERISYRPYYSKPYDKTDLLTATAQRRCRRMLLEWHWQQILGVNDEAVKEMSEVRKIGLNRRCLRLACKALYAEVAARHSSGYRQGFVLATMLGPEETTKAALSPTVSLQAITSRKTARQVSGLPRPRRKTSDPADMNLQRLHPPAGQRFDHSRTRPPAPQGLRARSSTSGKSLTKPSCSRPCLSNAYRSNSYYSAAASRHVR